MSLRKMRGLALYEPMPHQLPFHMSRAPERIVYGSNRAGKTLVSAAEVAWAVTGQHPHWDYPKEDGRWICVAKDQIKIGEVMYRKLFKRGAYRIIFDETTGYWRIWNPQTDKETFRETSPSLPLIAKEFVKKIAWEKRALNCPKVITFHNGWEMSFFTSAGKPIEGADYDGAWFDEEIYEGRWYTEIAARLIDRGGRFIWSATPDLSTDQFAELHEEAQKLYGTANPRIEEFFLNIDDNQYLTKAQVELFKAKLANNPEKYKVKVLGQFLNTSHRVYPNFNTVTHGCEPFEIPKHYTKYMVVDPGFRNCVATFFAVPPKNESPHIFMFDELYCHGVDCNEFAREVERKVRGQTFEAFLIDQHGARRSESNGKTIGQQFAEAFDKYHIKSTSTGSFFIEVGAEGWDDHYSTRDGISDVRSWLWNNDNGKPVLQVFHALCPNFVDEMKHYKNIVDQKTGKATDRPDQKKWSHGPDTLRYAKMHGLPYVEPRHKPKGASSVVKYYRDKMKRKRGAETVSM
jgi:hypothetical protein